MSRKIVRDATLLFLLSSSLVFAFHVQSGKAIDNAVITVPVDYPTIQEAINHANEGDTIYVYNGTYYENVVVNKTVSLVGEDKSTTIIDGGYGTVLNVTVNEVKLVGFTIRNGSAYQNSGIRLDHSNGTNIGNTIIVSNYYGIDLIDSFNNTISSNIEMNNEWAGLRLKSSSNNTVMDNIVMYSREGIDLTGTERNIIMNNNITQNDYGIFSSFGFDNVILGNNIANNTFISLQLLYSYNNTISGNIVANSRYGIFQRRCGNNTIYGNNIINNIYSGIYVEEPYYSCKVFHNNFINNTDQASISTLPSIWDNGYPSGGNYWSDHNPPDVYSGQYQNETGKDKIGDIAYTINEDNIDRYPLIYPYGFVPSVPDVNHDGIVDIFDIVVVAAAFATMPRTPGWNPIADLNQDEVIDIFDLVIIAAEFGKIYHIYL